MAYRHSEDDLAYGERWDMDRFVIERDRKRGGNGRDRSIERDRPDERDRTYTRAPARDQVRDKSVDGRFERRQPRPWDDDYSVREKKFYEDEPRLRRSPPPELERRVVFERERGRRDHHSPSPPPRVPPRVPTLVRRQSSLDSYDRRPLPRFFDRDEHSPPPPPRREYRPDPYQPIPLPRSRALPPPRIYAERDYEEIKISEPDRYGDEEFHAYPERVRERSVIRSKKRRDRSTSRTSRSRTHRSGTLRSNSRSSITSSSTSSSSSAGGTTVTVKSDYPKKGKTRIPAKLVSKRAIIDLGYPYIEEGGTVIIQKALGQQNIDDLLKLSEEYKKSEQEVAAARSVPGGFDDRREEVFTIPPPPAAPPAPITHMPPTPTFVHSPPPPPPQAHMYAPAPAPPAQYYNPPPAEYVRDTLVVRDTSPSRSHRSHRSRSTSTTTRTPYILDATPRDYREYSDDLAVGPLALVGDRRRSDKEIKMEIARLEAERELMKREKHHSRHRSHSHSHSRDRELVKAERLPTGELVVYEEQVEKIEEPRRGVRIEKDKKGRMTISVPKYR